MSASHDSGDGPVANNKGGNNFLHHNTWNFKFKISIKIISEKSLTNSRCMYSQNMTTDYCIYFQNVERPRII